MHLQLTVGLATFVGDGQTCNRCMDKTIGGNRCVQDLASGACKDLPPSRTGTCPKSYTYCSNLNPVLIADSPSPPLHSPVPLAPSPSPSPQYLPPDPPKPTNTSDTRNPLALASNLCRSCSTESGLSSFCVNISHGYSASCAQSVFQACGRPSQPNKSQSQALHHSCMLVIRVCCFRTTRVPVLRFVAHRSSS